MAYCEFIALDTLCGEVGLLIGQGLPPKMSRVTFAVSGMTNQMCAEKIETGLLSLSGISSAMVSPSSIGSMSVNRFSPVTDSSK
mgnify:CR=1 FL=1